ncbi:16S rRNA (guanine(966)-N(2))-methyltransferase RsmD [Aegicerativicinus sediminis]|uniref:16S rRNA (guanine(966)-N(2))-methyltransferase RsmD n=1 Tax=Aegicerativicinus sediminis TaxID=2893202 RepID=UPI001E4D0FEC|nr:16S rRNA (guanine(966)-N(2))-methyltransferase RsmD [Aegicerativicinus sediminis]
MRIISGTLKGRKINPPKNLPVRPTTDMAKEGLFNILNNHYYFDELKVLDLFSGTGSIAYEFVSRGAPEVIAVDQDFKCIKFIEQTASKLELPIRTIKLDVFKFLENNTQSFDVIFADPPYALDFDMFEKMVSLVIEKGMLKEEGQLIIEHSNKTDLSNLSSFINARNYGGTVFSFFEISN